MEQHQLVVCGTYGEKLGHVNGKGKGLYVLKFDRSSLAFTEDFGKAQLGDVFKNPSYVTVYRDSVADRLDVYVVEESHSDAGFVAALTLNESTGELACNGEPNRRDLADAAACCHVSVAPGGSHVLAANYLTGSVVAIARLPDGKLDGTNVQYVDLPPATHPITYPLPNAARQERAHAHMVRVSAGTKSSTVLVPDLRSARTPHSWRRHAFSSCEASRCSADVIIALRSPSSRLRKLVVLETCMAHQLSSISNTPGPAGAECQ